MGTRNATDLGVDLDRLTARRDEDPWIFLEGPTAWSMAEDFAALVGDAPCPACSGEPGRGGTGRRYCLRCDATSLDGRVEFPGLDVDERPDPDYDRPAPARRGPRAFAGPADYLHRAPR